LFQHLIKSNAYETLKSLDPELNSGPGDKIIITRQSLKGGIIQFHRSCLPGAGRDDKAIMGKIFLEVRICSDNLKGVSISSEKFTSKKIKKGVYYNPYLTIDNTDRQGRLIFSQPFG